VNCGARALASGSVADRVLNAATAMMTGGPSPYWSNAIVVPSAELAKYFQVTAGTMSSRLDRLERAGYIDRSIAPGNRASIKVTLTDAGQALHFASADDMIELRRDLMASALAPEDLAMLNSLLQQVLTGIETRDPPQPSP
jgi:DNA-binding MarR family transcriptional regulator